MSKRYEVKRFSSCYSLNWVDNKTNKELTAVEIEQIVNNQYQRIAELEGQLAEKDKEIEELKDYIGCKGCIDLIAKTRQDKISFAIELLEKVRELAEKEVKECNKLLQEEFEDDYYIQSVSARQSMCYEFRREINDQIEQLKGTK